MKKRILVSIMIIIGVIILFILFKGNGYVTEKTARCIGENSELYVQLGCHACEIQLEKFGENAKYLNITDCFYEREKCSDIQATPTWIINGEKYRSVRSIEELKELTGC